MSIYLTGFNRHIRKHIKASFLFTATTHLSDKEVKFFAEKGILGENIPMYEETQAWLKNYYIYVSDINQFLILQHHCRVMGERRGYIKTA